MLLLVQNKENLSRLLTWLISTEYVKIITIVNNKTCTIFYCFTKALVDGPTTGVSRQVMNVKSLYLTKFRVRIPHSAREKTLKKALAKAEFEKKWAESSWAKKLARANAKANLSDFERFKLMRAKQAVILMFYFSDYEI